MASLLLTTDYIASPPNFDQICLTRVLLFSSFFDNLLTC